MLLSRFILSSFTAKHGPAKRAGSTDTGRSRANCDKPCRRGREAIFWHQPASLGAEKAGIDGADARDRTGTGFPPRDFKSLASTNSATSAWPTWVSRDSPRGKQGAGAGSVGYQEDYRKICIDDLELGD